MPTQRKIKRVYKYSTYIYVHLYCRSKLYIYNEYIMEAIDRQQNICTNQQDCELKKL